MATYETVVPSGEDLATLARLAQEMFEAEAAVEDAESRLANAKERLRAVAERSIPELMAKVGMKEFRTTSGLRLRVEEVVSATIAPERRDEAVRWLDEHGEGGLVKRKVLVEFGREGEAEAETLVAELAGKGLAAARDYSIHPMTLKAFVRERLRNGEEIPEAITVAQIQRAKIST